jgi:hypothetical protein
MSRYQCARCGSREGGYRGGAEFCHEWRCAKCGNVWDPWGPGRCANCGAPVEEEIASAGVNGRGEKVFRVARRSCSSSCLPARGEKGEGVA